MLQVDGSLGEGGGQIVRTCIALAVVTGTPVRITNIRENRPAPGLKPQHMAAIKAICSLFGGKVTGLRAGSRTLVYEPGAGGRPILSIDVGTAGSITLVLQCIMLAALNSRRELRVRIKGGTDVRWSPPVDHLRNITLPFLATLGYRGSVTVNGRGYYPRGGGDVEFTYRPSSLRPITVIDAAPVQGITGISHCSGLPARVAERQGSACVQALEDHGLGPVEIHTEVAPGRKGCAGSGICVWSAPGYRGGSFLGSPGTPAEKVGKQAASELLDHVRKDVPVDPYLSDQLIPYLIHASGSLVRVHDTSHVRTNLAMTGLFFEEGLEVHDNPDGTLTIGSRGCAA